MLAGEVDVGDTIVLPGVDEPVLVLQVRMGHGGLIFTVAPIGGESEHEQILKLTTRVRVRKRARDAAM